MGKKEKTKMSLHDFLDSGDGPAYRDESDPKADRPQRPDLPLPTRPPFTAFVGNLSFEVVEGDLEDLFSALKTISIRIVRGPDERPKGFGYVEFGTLDDLKTALTKTGIELSGRPIRVSVADAPKEREESRSAGKWERTGPLPSLPSRGSFRGPDRGDGFRDRDEGEERDWTRGSKFVPSQDNGPPSRSGSSLGFARSVSERGKPRGGFADREGGGGGDEERDWTRGSKFVPSAPMSPPPSAGLGVGDGRKPGFKREDSFNSRRGTDDGPANWRGSGLGRSASNVGFQRTPPEPSPRLERRKLELAPRGSSSNVASPELAHATLPSSATSKPSPFGAARPIDSATKEREIEERLTKEAEVRKADVEKKEAERVAEAAKKPAAANPFGNAKPVDARAREEEIEKRLEKEKQERLEKMKTEEQAPKEKEREVTLGGAFTKSGGGGLGHGRTRSQQGKPRGPPPANGAGAGAAVKSPPTNAAPLTSPPPVKQSFRKEGFSYSSMARATSSPAPPLAPKTAKDVATETEKVAEQMGGMTVDA
ncbi:hypothetical protein BT69DRAFT_1318238 [Atractiella rhizophila]|nr:hypothetical protein BT69DRAFT_1318238 [Atractiella rhizophila]